MIHIEVVRSLVILFALLLVCNGSEDESGKAKITFINTSDEVIQLFWKEEQDGVENLVDVGSINAFDIYTIDSFIGHSFVADESSFTVIEPETNVFLGPLNLIVQCSTTEGDITAHIRPEWSPHGATRFLHLVETEYYNGCALNRVVKNFLTQFGISADYEKRTTYRSVSIPDDKSSNVKFEPGFLSYAGSGPDSRSTEVFIVMPNTPQSQLDHFGVNSWETPFGFVDQEDLEDVVAKWYSSYGDKPPPWGNGPDPEKMYQKDGYDVYLKQNFPLLSYIKTCEIIEYDADDSEDDEEPFLEDDEEL